MMRQTSTSLNPQWQTQRRNCFISCLPCWITFRLSYLLQMWWVMHSHYIQRTTCTPNKHWTIHIINFLLLCIAVHPRPLTAVFTHLYRHPGPHHKTLLGKYGISTATYIRRDGKAIILLFLRDVMFSVKEMTRIYTTATYICSSLRWFEQLTVVFNAKPVNPAPFSVLSVRLAVRKCKHWFCVCRLTFHSVWDTLSRNCATCFVSCWVRSAGFAHLLQEKLGILLSSNVHTN